MANYLKNFDLEVLKNMLKEAYEDIKSNPKTFTEPDGSITYTIDTLVSAQHGHNAANVFLYKYKYGKLSKVYKKDDLEVNEEAEELMGLMEDQLNKTLKPPIGNLAIGWREGAIELIIYLEKSDINKLIKSKKDYFVSGIEERDSIQIEQTWSELKKFGIIFLTGESDAYGRRILCDLTLEGKNFMEAFLGITINSKPWNPDGVASILLSPEMIDPLIIFILLFKGYHVLKFSNKGRRSRFYLGFKNIENIDSLKKESPELASTIEETIINNPISGSYRGRVQHRYTKRIE